MAASRTGRRCDNCRRRKKKCYQIQPSCSRCSRLGLECIGSGEQTLRYVGVNTVRSKIVGQNVRKLALETIKLVPSNSTSLLRGSFVAVVQCDWPQYGLGLIGSMSALSQIPTLLGSNDALDWFSKSIVHAHAAFVAGVPSVEALQCFTIGLAKLRTYFARPAKVSSLANLAAIYMMLVAQAMMGTCFNAAHGEGLAYLVNAAAEQFNAQDAFANELLACLASQLLLEAIVNPKIKLSPRVFEILAQREQQNPFHTLSLLQYARLRHYIQNPAVHASEIRSSYQTTVLEVAKFRKDQMALFPRAPIQVRAVLIVSYSLMLCYTALVSTIMLRSNDSNDVTILEDSRELMDEVFAVIGYAKEFRPAVIGLTGTMVLCAWPNDPSRRHELEKAFAELAGKFPVIRLKESARWLDRLLTPLETSGTAQDVDIAEPSDACLVM